MFRYLIISIVLVVACNDAQIKCKDFEIAKVDYHDDNLQRIFVVISSSKMNDTVFICTVITALKKSYEINKNTAISFFSDKKYANYKTDLFMNNTHSLPISAYENWSNAYLGEYEFETNEYKIFPILNLSNKQITYTLKSCY